jgi:hypothetical protein
LVCSWQRLKFDKKILEFRARRGWPISTALQSCARARYVLLSKCKDSRKSAKSVRVESLTMIFLSVCRPHQSCSH